MMGLARAGRCFFHDRRQYRLSNFQLICEALVRTGSQKTHFRRSSRASVAPAAVRAPARDAEHRNRGDQRPPVRSRSRSVSLKMKSLVGFAGSLTGFCPEGATRYGGNRLQTFDPDRVRISRPFRAKRFFTLPRACIRIAKSSTSNRPVVCTLAPGYWSVVVLECCWGECLL
jgi:hypothetical protein